MRQGKTHNKEMFSKVSSIKHLAIASCRYGNVEYDDIYDNIKDKVFYPLPKLIRPKIKRNSGYWNEYGYEVENNWKQRKMRHQYQWHYKRNCTKRIYKSSPLYLNYDDIDIRD